MIFFYNTKIPYHIYENDVVAAPVIKFVNILDPEAGETTSAERTSDFRST
jgi:hypothetical protein